MRIQDLLQLHCSEMCKNVKRTTLKRGAGMIQPELIVGVAIGILITDIIKGIFLIMYRHYVKPF